MTVSPVQPRGKQKRKLPTWMLCVTIALSKR